MIERTLILAKPDGIQRGLVGEILTRFERQGFRIAGMKMVHPTEQHLSLHYPDDPAWKANLAKKTRASWLKKGIELKETDEQIADKIRGWNMDSMRAPIVAIIFEGIHAVEAGRKIVGHTEPRSAVMGTIRGDYSTDSYMNADDKKRPCKNLVHASGSVEEAEKEIEIWFNKDELYAYDKQDFKVMYE